MPLPRLSNQHALSARSVRWVAEVYGLGTVLSYAPLATGYLNNNYRVETERGRYFVKHHIKARRSALEAQHRLLRSLQEVGLSVAAPLMDPYGRTYVTVSHRPVSVFPWIEGVHRDGPTLTDLECEAVGGLLGRTHRALEQVGGGAQQPFLLPPIRAEWALALAQQLLETIASRQPPEPFDTLAEEFLVFTVQQLESASGGVGDEPCLLSWQLTHGDFNPLTVLFGSDDEMTIVDWDRVRVQPRLLEMPRTMVLWLADDETGSIDLESARSLLRGYLRWVRVDPRTLSETVDYIWWQKLNDLWILKRHYLEADNSADDLAARTLRWLRWLTLHRGVLVEALADEAQAAMR